MARRISIVVLSVAAATLAACSSPTAPTAKPKLGVYQGSTSKTTPSASSTQGVYMGSTS